MRAGLASLGWAGERGRHVGTAGGGGVGTAGGGIACAALAQAMSLHLDGAFAAPRCRPVRECRGATKQRASVGARTEGRGWGGLLRRGLSSAPSARGSRSLAGRRTCLGCRGWTVNIGSKEKRQ